ncbi:MAG: 2-hydroxyacyl-CoA dehydratase, partial [Dehalococcoidia bacterium]
MAVKTLYETKPLECYQYMKEVRRNYVRRLWSAKDRGGAVFVGGYADLTSLPMGLGDINPFGFGPYFARILRDKRLAIQCHEAMESRGFGHDICGTLRTNLGSAYLNFQNRAPSGEYVHPDFILEVHMCEAQSKTAQLYAEHYKVPMFSIDMPMVPSEHDPRIKRNYLAAQLYEAIDWMQKVTGKEFQDELFLKAVRNEWRSRWYWARTCELQKATPAPLDLRLLNSYAAMTLTSNRTNEGANAIQMLYEETEQRVRDKVASLATERCRLLHEGQPPYYYPPFLKFPREFGATVIGGRTIFTLFGAFMVDDEGVYHIAQPPWERGQELRTREDGVKALVELFTEYARQPPDFLIGPKIKEVPRVAQDWHADGVILHQDISCKGGAAGLVESRHALQEVGIPTMLYEASNPDPRDLSEAQVMDRLESFL